MKILFCGIFSLGLLMGSEGEVLKKTEAVKPKVVQADCRKWAFCYPPQNHNQLCKQYFYYLYFPNAFLKAGYTGSELVVKEYFLRLLVIHQCEW